MAERRSRGEAAWLAPGQIPTRKFPVVGERTPAAAALDLDAWRLEIGGRVRCPYVLAYEEILACEQEEVVPDVHCVTGWSQRGLRFTGTRLGPLLERAEPRPGARFVRLEAYSDRRHDTSIPLAVALEETWLVHACDGEPLTVEHGWPLRTLTPSRYLYKSLKWVRLVEVLDEDRLGFWERDQGYHNTGDPWKEQRYVRGAWSRSEIDSLRRGRRLDPFRNRLVLGADLQGWDPEDRDLRRLVLKNCDLRGARLSGADLRGSNLCRSDLRGADLCEADLRDTDLEGVRLAGAELSRADVRGASLVATDFGAGERPSRVTGLRWSGDAGLLEDAEAFLRSSDAADPS